MNIYINCNVISHSKNVSHVTQTITEATTKSSTEATNNQYDTLIELLFTQIIELKKEVAFLKTCIDTEATNTEATTKKGYLSDDLSESLHTI